MWNLNYGDFPIVTGNLMLWIVLAFIENKQKETLELERQLEITFRCDSEFSNIQLKKI